MSNAPGTGEAVLFWILGPLAVLGSLGLIFAKKAVHAALGMALTMIILGIFYIAQDAHFLGVIQVIVYTGAVMMLFLFVVMLVGVDASDSLVETLKGQRAAAVLLSLGLAVLMVLTIGTAMRGVPAVGMDEANAAHGGNVEGLAHLMFTTYLLPLQVVASLLITAALGALVLAHRERWSPRRGQEELSKERIVRYAEHGEHPGPLPSPGVLATSNAIGTPALLPDGSPTDLSIPIPLRGEPRTRLAVQPDEIAADFGEVHRISAGEETMRDPDLDSVDGHVDVAEVYPDEKGQ